MQHLSFILLSLPLGRKRPNLALVSPQFHPLTRSWQSESMQSCRLVAQDGKR